MITVAPIQYVLSGIELPNGTIVAPQGDENGNLKCVLASEAAITIGEVSIIGITYGAGAVVTATTPRVTLASDDPAVASLGAKADTPVADNTTVEDSTPHSGISLWKRIVNLLIALLGKAIAQPTSETAAVAETTTSAAWTAGVSIPTGAYAMDVTITGDSCYAGFTSTGSAPAQTGRRLLVNSTVRLFAPSAASGKVWWKGVSGTTTTVDYTWLIR